MRERERDRERDPEQSRDREPSRTALQAAMVRALESSRRSGRLFEDPYAAAFAPGWARLLLRTAALLRLTGALERFVDARQPAGPRGYTVLRTRIIDDLCVEGVAAGADQVVLLGAGYDTRAYRLPGLAGVTVFEVDHPDTQRRKRALLPAGAAAARSSPVRFVPVDFTAQDLGSELRAAGFRDGAATVVVWEGVAAYLTTDAVAATLDWVASATAPGSRLLFTYLDPAVMDGRDDGAAAWAANTRAGGEPLRFAFGPDTLAGELAGHGLRPVADVTAAEAAERLFAPLGRTDRTTALGHIVHAERSAP